MGDLGEQWSREELGALQRGGWRIIHRVLFRRADDIDHVAIGPGGVVVIETKWSSADWKSPRQSDRIADAVRQVTRHARDVRLFLHPDIGVTPVRPVVVLWPSDKRLEQPDVAGVTVMAGLSLKDWIQALPADVLDEQAIAAAWNRIEAHLARRDAADLVRDGPPPRSVVRYLTDLAQMPVGIVLGFIVAVSLFSWAGLPEYLLVAAAIGLASLMARGVGRVRLLATGFFLGSQATILAALVAIVVSETT